MSKVRILVAEDDREISRLIELALQREEFIVTCAYNGADALRLFEQERCQIMILDLMLPEIDGFEVLRRIRDESNTPVLILSAKDAESDKIVGLGLGADDYMTKPFGVGELVARVKAQLRRYLDYSPDASDAAVLRRTGIEMNTQTYEVTVGGRPVTLTAKEFEILKLFMMNPKKVFTKQQLFRSVWGGAYLNDENTVMVHISRLREKIEDDPSGPKRIQTVWGIGYKLADE
ncbi:MAG: response regulator transcription factor [Clostridiaceae bacterium]|nr:response regulator transcription factor [Clostridiaceae bacterium]